MAALGKEVGRVSIRVIPSTREFGPDLHRYLKRIEKSMRVKIPVRLDDEKLEGDLKRIGNRLDKSVRGGVQVPVKVDPVSAARSMSRQVQRVKLEPLKLDVDPEMAGFQRRVETDIAALRKRLKVEIPVSPETDRLRGEIAAEIETIERTLRLGVPVDPDLRRSFRRSLQAQLDLATESINVHIPVKVEDEGLDDANRKLNELGDNSDKTRRKAGALGGAFSTTFRSMGRITGGFTSIFDGIGKSIRRANGVFGKMRAVLGSVFAVMAGLVLQFIKFIPLMAIVAAGIGLIAGAVSALSGAIAAGFGGLPVLITALGAPIAAVMLGMDGIKRAAKQLKPHFEDLKKSVSTVFEQQLLPVFDKLHAVFPVLERGFIGIATRLSNFADVLVGVVTSAEGLKNIENALAGAQTVIDLITPGMERLLTAFLDVAGTAPLYRVLGNTLNGVLDGLGGFLQRIKPQLVPALREFDLVLRSAGGALGELLIQSTKFFTEAGPGFQKFWKGVREAFANIDFEGMGESFGRIFAAIGEGLKNVPPETWQALADAVQEFADAIETLVATGTITTLIEGFQGLIGVAENLVRALGATMHAVIAASRAIRGDFAGAAVAWGQAWGTMFSTVKEKGPAIANEAGKAGRDSANKFEYGIRPLPADAKWAAQGATSGLTMGLAPMPGRAGGIATDASNRVESNLRQANTYSAGRSVMQGLINGMQSMMYAAGATAYRIGQFAVAQAEAATGVRSPSTVFFDIGRNLILGLVQGIRQNITSVLSVIRELATRIAATLRQNNPFAELPNMVRLGTVSDDVWEGLLDAGWKGDPTDRMEALYRPGTNEYSPATGGSSSDLYDAVFAALNGAQLRVDGSGVARLVNETNRRNSRR